MHFTKMHGIGNDYLYVFGEAPSNIAELSIKLSNRNYGAGSDGMIYISKSEIADFKMRIFNADGSEALMCGNGIRCVGKYVFDKGYTNKTEITVETMTGIKTLNLNVVDGVVKTVSVEMGRFVAESELALPIGEDAFDLLPVSMGNPHAVIFVESVVTAPVTTAGKQIEKHPFFPNGVNVEFIEVIEKNKLRMRVWERGSGETMACGTGACASAAAAILKGYCDYNTEITVCLNGGDLSIFVSNDGSVVMTGPAETVYEAEVEI